MEPLDERVSYLEGRVEESSRSFGELRELTTTLDQRVSAIDQKMDRRFDALEAKLDRRFEAIDRRFEGVDRRFEGIDRRFGAIDRRFWALITIQITILLTIIGGFFGVVNVLLRL